MKKCFALAAAAVLVFGQWASADILNVSTTGAEGWGAIGDPNNTTMTIEVGNRNFLQGVAWDVVITANGPSWYNEARVVISDSLGGPGVTLTPGAADSFAGNGAPLPYDSGGLLVFSDLSIADLVLTDSNGDGSNDFTLEFFESFVDGVQPDSVWADGSAGTNPSGAGGLDFSVVVPEPSAFAIIAMGLIAAVGRRRR